MSLGLGRFQGHVEFPFRIMIELQCVDSILLDVHTKYCQSLRCLSEENNPRIHHPASDDVGRLWK